jgi:very-short-patch-repair endonuclease
MGYLEALEDGIEFVQQKNGWYYLIPCELCGVKIKGWQYGRKRTYLCKYCRDAINKKEKILLDHIAGIETPAEKRFCKAVENIEKQVKHFEKYEKAIKMAKGRAEKYASIPEAMVAIELLKNKHRVIPQQRVGKYRVDFVLPDEKKAIEVDGELYHRNKRNDGREGIIQLTLGLDWKIIHIPAELIAKDIRKLEKAINITK